ncbi:MAG: hypothetical protein ACQEXX_25225 [Bacillota bacterium]
MNNRSVSIAGTIHVQDYETFDDNEHASGYFSKTLTVDDAHPQASENVPPPKICAGGEIWPAFDLTVSLMNQAGDVNISIDGKLYEGSSCDTTDHDGSHNSSFIVRADTQVRYSFNMWNTAEGNPKDKADITLSVRNSPNPSEYILEPFAISGDPALAFASHKIRARVIAKNYALTHPLNEEGGEATENNTIDLIAHLQAASDDPNFSVPGMEKSKTLAIKMLRNLHKGHGRVGTDIKFDGVMGFGELHIKGDYDMALKGIMVILYRYRHLLNEDDVTRILTSLVPEDLNGPHDPRIEEIIIRIQDMDAEHIPETENHMLMINSIRYLINQILFEKYGHERYDNNANKLTKWLLDYMHKIAKHDFLEFNSRPYQRLSLHALLNLHEFAKDKLIRTAAQILLDYTMVKFAVSSNRQRRICPFRRLKKNMNLPNNEHNKLLEPQVGGKDALIGFFHMYVGPNDANGNPTDKFLAGWGMEAVIAGLAGYRPPPAAYILAMKRDNPNTAFQHRFYHGARPKLPGTDDQADGGVEIYYSSPSFLLTAGGMFLNSGYGGDEWSFINYKDTAIAQSTTLLPTRADVKFADLIRFDPYPDERTAVNTGVHCGFACGANLRPCEKMTFSESSNLAPTLASHDGRLYLSWTGSGNERLNIAKVYTTEALDIYGIESFEDKVVLGDTSEQSPALVSHNGELILAWKGTGNDKLNLIFSNDGGKSFHGRKTFDETSHHAPALASHGGRLYLAWTGRGDGKLNVAKVTFLGTTTGSFNIVLEDKVILEHTSEQSPALFSHNDRLFIAWKGSSNDNLNLMFSEDNGASFHVIPTFDETSLYAPALASHGGRLYLAWTGRGDGKLNVAKVTFLGTTTGSFNIVLEDKVILEHTSEQSPALFSHNDRLFIAWKGVDNNRLNVMSSHDGGFQTEPWIFCDLSRFGLYVSIYRTPPAFPDELDKHIDNLGLLYAYDITIESNPLDFKTFKQLTLERNKSLPAKFDSWGRYVFHSADDHRFTFWLHPSTSKYLARIVRMDEEELAVDFRSLPLVEGKYMKAPGRGGHDGLIEICYPGCEIPLELNFSNPENPVRKDNMLDFPQPWLDRAQALYNVVVQLSQAGRGGEVVGPAEEAVQLYRQLAAASGADVITIARYLLDLSRTLSHYGHDAESVDAAQAVVEVLRGFEPAPDAQAAHLKLFAEALHTLMQRLIQDGRASEAVEPASEAVQVYRQLAAASGANVTQIAEYLLRLSSDVATVALLTEGVSAAQAAVEILRGFEPAPDAQAAHLKLFAEALYTLAVRLQTAGHVHEAIPPAEEAVQVLRGLAEVDPDHFGLFLQKAEQLVASLTQS